MTHARQFCEAARTDRGERSDNICTMRHIQYEVTVDDVICSSRELSCTILLLWTSRLDCKRHTTRHFIMNAILLILLLLIIDVNVSAASGPRHLRGERTKSNKLDDPQDRNADATEEESICQDVDMDLVGTKWKLTNFTWHGFPDEGEETLKPVTRERRGMTLLLEEDGFSGTCGNNLCWGVAEKIGGK
eukprot:scaffold3397_cov70-Skeletonema_dohrnii-CCMP3373.AAC.1